VEERCEEGGLPLLLSGHFKARSTGVLEVSAGAFSKRLFLEEGRVVFASSNDRNDRLGEMLIRRGVLAVPDFFLASRDVAPGKRFGTILVERGLLSPEQLVWAVKEQVKEIVFSLFPVPEARCAFREGEGPGEEGITLNLRTPELIRQGVLRMDHTVRPLEAFAAQERTFGLVVPLKEVEAAFDLGPAEREAAAALTVPRPLPALFRAAPLPQFAFLKFLWVLLLLDMARLGPPAAPEPEEGPELELTGEDLQKLL